MTTVDEIRARHTHNCAGPCDVAYLLAELDAASRLLKSAYLAHDKIRDHDEMQAQRIDHLVSSVRSLRQQRTYLVRRLHGLEQPRNGQHRQAVILKLRRQLRHVREQLDLQTEATKRQKEKTRRIGGYNHAATVHLDRLTDGMDRLAERLRLAEAGAATLRTALQRIGDGWYLASDARAIAAEALRVNAGDEWLADYRRLQDLTGKLSDEVERLQANYACVSGMRAALIRARDDLEALTCERQAWIDAAMIGQELWPEKSTTERTITFRDRIPAQ